MAISLVRIAVAEYRQRECRLSDKHVARHEFERRTGRIGDVLVIAGGNDAQTVGLDRDLRGAEDMTGGMKRYFNATEIDAFAVADGLGCAGKILAVTQPHQVEGFLRRQHRTVTGAGMIGMSMGDQRPLHRPRRIDVEGTKLAAHACRRRHQDVFRTHGKS